MVDSDRPDIQTPDLDRFLSEDPGNDAPRLLTAKQALELFTKAERGANADALLKDGQLHQHAIVVLWRWARAAATAVGRCSDDETLDAALGDLDPNPWTARLVPRPTPIQRALLRQGATSALYTATAGEGICLLPPTDGRIARWIDAFESVTEDIGVKRAPRGPDVLRLLMDHALAPLVRVSTTQLYALEELMVDQAQRVLFRHGERGVMDHFREKYGLSRRECLGLVRLARADALQYGRSSVEDDRALMVAMLKNYTDRARETMNMGDEIRALRELARVQGLTRTEPEDKMSEFLGVVRRVSGRQDALQLVSAAADAVGAEPEDLSEGLEGSLPIDKDAPDVEDVSYRLTERNALQRFDAEDVRARQEEEVG